MCNLRNNIALLSSTATLYICLFWSVLCFTLWNYRFKNESYFKQHKNSGREEGGFVLLLHAFDAELFWG